MRWHHFLFLLAIGTVSLHSCRDDFDITADYEEIPLVYGILSLQDSAHFIRIQRAFIDKETNAYVVAKSQDSIYYPDILAVEMEEIETGKSIKFDRVNGDTMGLPKDQGYFANEKNILYRSTHIIQQNFTYRLKISNLQTGHIVRAETKIVGPFISILPNNQYIINWSGDEEDLVNFNWRTAENAGVYDLTIDFHYQQWHYGQNDTVKKILSWAIFSNKVTQITEPDFGIGYEYPTRRFFQYIGSHLPAENQLNRKALSVHFHLSAGGNAFAQYVSHQQAQTGITGQMASAPFSNIENGIGFVSSRYTMHFPNLLLGAETLDSLVSGQFTAHLGFIH